MLLRLIAALLFLSPALAGDRLLVCGGNAVYQIDPAATPPAKQWTWRALDCAGLPEELKGTFNSTDDCKPLAGGKRLLVSSSGGGCVLLEMPSGKALWWARATNAHSIEALPGGLIAVAASVGKGGDKVVLFDESVPAKPLAEIPLPSAHGLVWDEGRKCLWALGFGELIACRLDGRELVANARHKLPDDDGHDLRAVPGSPELVLSTHAGVWRFHRDTGVFRADPGLEGRVEVKGVDFHPKTGRLAVVQAAGGNWWTDTIELAGPAAKIRLEDEVIYKARWLAE